MEITALISGKNGLQVQLWHFYSKCYYTRLCTYKYRSIVMFQNIPFGNDANSLLFKLLKYKYNIAQINLLLNVSQELWLQ